MSGVIRSPAYHQLREAFAQPGCPLCALVLTHLRRTMSAYLYEYSMDRDFQRDFRASLGFCSVHAQAALDVRGSSANIATLYEQVLYELVDRAARPGRRPSDSFAARQPCALCASASTYTASLIEALGDSMADADFRHALHASTGFCLRHTRELLRGLRQPAARDHVMNLQRKRWNDLREELDRFMARTGERGGGAALEGEGDSWSRALQLISGPGGVFGDDMPDAG